MVPGEKVLFKSTEIDNYSRGLVLHVYTQVHSNQRLKSLLWKLRGEKNPIEGSQAPLLADAGLDMLLFAMCTVHTVYKLNMYRIDDHKEKVNYLDPDWELTVCELVHEMSEQYKMQGINIPKSCRQVRIMLYVTWFAFSQKLQYD